MKRTLSDWAGGFYVRCLVRNLAGPGSLRRLPVNAATTLYYLLLLLIIYDGARRLSDR